MVAALVHSFLCSSLRVLAFFTEGPQSWCLLSLETSWLHISSCNDICLVLDGIKRCDNFCVKWLLKRTSDMQPRSVYRQHHCTRVRGWAVSSFYTCAGCTCNWKWYAMLLWEKMFMEWFDHLSEFPGVKYMSMALVGFRVQPQLWGAAAHLSVLRKGSPWAREVSWEEGNRWNNDWNNESFFFQFREF